MMIINQSNVFCKDLFVVFLIYDKHPHSALGYRSLREYRRRRESLT